MSYLLTSRCNIAETVQVEEVIWLSTSTKIDDLERPFNVVSSVLCVL